MIIGMDVSFKGNAKEKKAITSMVASANGRQGMWFTQIVEEVDRGELSNALETLISNACKNFYNNNNKQPPERLILYREGATASRMIKHEVPQIIRAFKNLPNNYSPELLVITCEKRVNTRIFRMGGQVSNPGPGTVVDNTIVDKDYLDFYLVPQNVREGTVTPTKYQVVYNKSGFGIDLIQLLTYSLCHIYYNWFGTVRVPAPVMFAKKAAQLATSVLKTEAKEVSPSLANKLYHL